MSDRTKFVKSRVKTDPSKLAYYRRKYDTLNNRIHWLYAECERIDPTGCAPLTPEEAAHRREIDTLESKRQYYATQIMVALRMQSDTLHGEQPREGG